MTSTARRKARHSRVPFDLMESKETNEESAGEGMEAGTAMGLSEEDVARQHYASTVAMCLCTFTHSWLLVSVFPYSGFLVIKLVPGTNEETAGSYAGILAASFMIGRAITSYGWGKIADAYGRRVVFFFSLVLSAVCSLSFGLSGSFLQAFFWRFLLGASNGVAGISKAVVSETAKGNDILETKGMSLSMGMWAWGFLLSPALSGFLSDPIRQYPFLWHNEDKDSNRIYRFLATYPFILPNLVSILLCVINIFAVALWVPETLPVTNLRSPSNIPLDFYNWNVALFRRCTFQKEIDSENIGNDHQLYGNDGTTIEDDESLSLLPGSNADWFFQHDRTILETSYHHLDAKDAIRNTNIDTEATLSYFWSKKDTRNHLVVFWLFSFVAIAIDEAFPLFCMSKQGGLGLTEREIGKLLSATGILFAITQYHVYGWIVDRYGLRRSILLGAILSAPLVTLVPISLLWKQDTGTTNFLADTFVSQPLLSSIPTPKSSLTYASFVYLGVLLSFIRVFGLVFFSSIAIATNRTVKHSERGRMNGLSMLGGSVAKGLGPMFAGALVSNAISSGRLSPTAGAVVIFVVFGLFASLTAGITVCLLVADEENGHSNPTDENDSENGGGSIDLLDGHATGSHKRNFPIALREGHNEK